MEISRSRLLIYVKECSKVRAGRAARLFAVNQLIIPLLCVVVITVATRTLLICIFNEKR